MTGTAVFRTVGRRIVTDANPCWVCSAGSLRSRGPGALLRLETFDKNR